MNPEEAKNHCDNCGDPILTQHEIDFELCDECFNELKEEEQNDLIAEERNAIDDPDGTDRNCEL